MADESLREALEKAYVEQEAPSASSSPESGGSVKDTPEPVRDTAPTERSEPREEPSPREEPAAQKSGERERGADGKFLKKEETPTPEPKPAVEPTTHLATQDKAPESWRPATREHWAKLPKEVRDEVNKREADMNQFVQQSAAKRKIADSFIGVVRPYEGLIRAEGGNPVQIVENMLATAAFLRTGSSAQKAVMVAKMVKDYGISVQDLDNALAGQPVDERPEDKISKIIDERLKPVQEILGTVQRARTEREQKMDKEMDDEIAAFAADPKNEFFDDVRRDMADFVELASRRGENLSLAAAYEKAVKFNPDVQEILRKRAEEKRSASSSLPIRGPSATVIPKENASLRDDLLSAMETVANR